MSSTAVEMGSSVFWDFMKHLLVVIEVLGRRVCAETSGSTNECSVMSQKSEELTAVIKIHIQLHVSAMFSHPRAAYHYVRKSTNCIALILFCLTPVQVCRC